MSDFTENSAELDKLPSHSRIALALAFTGVVGIIVAVLFLPAGRLNWVAGWVYVLLIIVNTVINYVYLRQTNPTLIVYRTRIGHGTKTWDTILMAVLTPVLLSVYGVAGLDAGRLGGSAIPSLIWPALLWPLGFALFMVGAVLLTWSMGVNPFFEKTVRIRTERGQRVVDTGPYRFVRHPGYAGFGIWILSVPLLLGSWWAFFPAILSIAIVVVRTAWEDRTLRQELPGYREYTDHVRFRLIPDVW